VTTSLTIGSSSTTNTVVISTVCRSSPGAGLRVP